MSESTEMYLETILVIQKKKGHVRSIDIAREMNFSKPTISQQMKRLKEKELINMDEDGAITLTDAGAKIANMIFERHTELRDILIHIGVSESTASQDACRITPKQPFSDGLGGYLREQKRNSCTQAGPKTRKEE